MVFGFHVAAVYAVGIQLNFQNDKLKVVVYLINSSVYCSLYKITILL